MNSHFCFNNSFCADIQLLVGRCLKRILARFVMSDIGVGDTTGSTADHPGRNRARVHA
jgi:hypothetical protein